MTLHDPAHLLDHAAWLRSLAASLVGDRATADDLVQDTYAAALRRPPSLDRPVKPWLARVLRNAAKFRWRSEANRSAREISAATVAERETPTSAELLERHETQQLLARLVGELEEPYREAILLRFAEGLAPKEIARQLGVPAGTVRWRISEGLARLRTRLDAAHAGDRKAWLAALAPLVGRAPAVGVPIAIVAALIAIAAIALVLVVRRHDADVPSASPVGSHSPPHTPARSAATTAIERSNGWRAQPGVPRRRIAGRVLVDGSAPAGPRDGAEPRSSTRSSGDAAGADAPAAGALVTLTQDGASREQRTDHDGRFDFGPADATALTLSATAAGKVATIVHVEPRDPRVHTDDLEIALTPCVASLWGFVRDPEGAPIAGARVLREDVVGAESDATGAYEVCALPTATELVQLLLTVRADGYGAIHALPAPKGRVQRDFIMTPEAIITGRVIAESGEPIANARVMLAADSDGTLAYEDMPAPATATTDGAGAFQISGVRGGRVRLIAEAPNAISAPVSVLATSGETRAVTLRARATGTIRGRVLVGDHPAPGARVTARVSAFAAVAPGSPGFAVASGVPDLAAVTQPDGTFVIARVPAGRADLEISGYRALAPLTVEVRAGAEAATDIAVAPLVTMRGIVRRGGVVVPHARVSMNGPSKLGTTADGAGAYAITGLEPGHYHLHSDDTRMGAYLDTTIDLPDVAEHGHDVELSTGAQVRGIVVDAAGAPFAGAFVALTLRGTPAPTLPVGDLAECVTAADGRFACGEMGGGGAYTAEVFSTETMRIPLRFAVPPPAIEVRDTTAVVDGVRLVVERSDLAIAGTVVDTAGAPIGDASVQLHVEKRDLHRWAAMPQSITGARGAFRIGGLAPGTYTIGVLTQDGIRHEQPAVVAGAAGVTIVVDRATCDGDGAVRDRTRAEPTVAARPPAPVRWDDRVELIGWTVQTDEQVELAVVYQVLKPLDRPWKTFVHLLGPAWVNADHDPLDGRCPTTTWRPGDYLVDRISLEAAKPGRYDVLIGLFRGPAPHWTNLPITAAPAAMRADGDQLRITTIDVR